MTDFFAMILNKLTSSGGSSGTPSPISKAAILDATINPNITVTIEKEV